MRFGGLWRHRDFVKLWVGQTVSDFGSIIGLSAIPFTAIIALDASPIEVAALTASRVVPQLVIGLPAGVWVDRLSKRPVLIVTDIARAIVLLTVPLAWLLDALVIEQLYVVAFVTGGLTVFFQVAYRSYLPSLVERDELIEGNSKLTATSAVSEFAGFSVSGWLVQVFSGPFAIFIDALTFGVSAIFIGRIEKREDPPPAPSEHASVRQETVDGLRTVAHDRLLRVIAASGALHWVGFGVIGAVYGLFVIRDLGFEPGVLGVIFGIGGISSLIGAVYAERAASRFGIGPSMALGVALFGVCMVFTLLAPVDAMIVAGALLVAAQLGDGAYVIYDVNAVSLRQSVTPDAMLGRVNAFMHVDEQLSVLVGTLLGGVLGELIGLRPVLALGAALIFASAAFLAVSPVRRTIHAPVAIQELPAAG
jgi:Na+/melibiose symporter-like transporter